MVPKKWTFLEEKVLEVELFFVDLADILNDGWFTDAYGRRLDTRHVSNQLRIFLPPWTSSIS